MKKQFLLTVGISLFLMCTAMPTFAQVSNDNEDGVNKVDERVRKNDFVPGQVLVKMKDSNPASVRRAQGKFRSAGISSLDQVLSKFDVEEMEQLLPNAKVSKIPRRAKAYNGATIVERDLTQIFKISLSKEKLNQTLQLVDELKALDEVEFAEPNYKVFISAEDHIADSYNENPLTSQQWYLDNYGVKELWNKPVIKSKRPVIAIIDTGVDLTHPDLVDNLWTNTAEAEGAAGYDNDKNGFKGDVHGWDFINNTPNIRDNNMHGTHVAGIAAAANNGVGIIGANPQALIMPITVIQSDGSGDVATLVKGIDYAVNNGADILNLSLGAGANSRSLRLALERAYQTTVIVAAAGNGGTPVDPDCGFPGQTFPAAYSFVLGVMATNESGNVAEFSNYDCNGPTYSSISTVEDPDGFNYELKAPGTNMLSAIPGGNYKKLNGTSMSAPLVAGAISALKMVKEYDNQEILWGDLLHTDNIAQAYAITERPAELYFVNMQFRDRKELDEETEEDYSGDNEIDAGETVSIYPVIRTTFGEANNIKLKLERANEFDDPNTVEILTDVVDFGWHLDPFGRNVSVNPLKVKIANNVADNRHIQLKVLATCDNTDKTIEWPFTIIVNNMVKINGLLTEDRTLTADHVYYVNADFGIMEGVTLTIEPGTHLEFADNTVLKSFGKLIAKGTPEKPIIFKGHYDASWKGVQSHAASGFFPSDTISYCKIYNTRDWDGGLHPVMQDCYLSDIGDFQINYYAGSIRNTITGIGGGAIFNSNYWAFVYPKYSNYVNNSYDEFDYGVPQYSNLWNCNFINSDHNLKSLNKYYRVGIVSETPVLDKSDYPSYLGTSREDLVRPYIYEAGNAPNTWGTIDLSNMPSRPYAEAHGIVWKVVVNGKDAQDEYEDLAPLGVGKHKFEVYFNRPMNKAVIPNVAFGPRYPYTQNAVNEDGGWNEEGTIYTAYKTITGKTQSDGVNRIYVWGAEDNEYFECPYEKTRFNINIQSAGAMATGFVAEAGLGKVKLTWNNENNDFDDAMGFNIYRFNPEVKKTIPGHYENGKWIAATEVVDTILINTEILDIETVEYTDYDVNPGSTYYYLYKVLSTDLQEYDVSNVVAATPLTATLGDANGSGEVDVADVITTVNKIVGMEPKPFIFEAADVNVDLTIDVLDIIGIIQKIVNPEAGVRIMAEAEAVYTIEDGTLYVESPVALAGVQVQIALSEECRVKSEEFATAEDLDGFEHTSAWLSENDYLFLAYNLNGKTLSAGKHALLYLGDAKISDIRLSDADGHNVKAVGDETTRVNRIVEAMTVKGIYDLQGRKLSGDSKLENALPKGVYIINGKKVVK